MIRGVQAFVGGKPGRNLGVTVEAFEGCLAAKLVATRTIRGAVEGLVRLRERAWRNLRRRSPKGRDTQTEKSGIEAEATGSQPQPLQMPAGCV